MKTSKIVIRPYIPFFKDEEKEGRSPYATLTYGNVVVEIDLQIVMGLRINSGGHEIKMIFREAVMEIIEEMQFDLYGKLSPYHRDSDHRKETPNEWFGNPKHVKIERYGDV